MKKLDFKNESRTMLLVVRRNEFKYYFSIILILLSLLLSLRFLYVWYKFNDFVISESYGGQLFYFSIVVILPLYLYDEYYKSQKEQFLIICIDALKQYYFWHKKENRKEAKYLDLTKYGIISISLKDDGEIILLSERELPWGNRKIVISDEFKDRKEEVLNFLKLNFL